MGPEDIIPKSAERISARISELEDIVGTADVKAFFDCEAINDKVASFRRGMNAYIAKRGLGRCIEVVNSKPKSLSVLTPEIRYNTLKILLKTDIPEDRRALAQYVFDEHKFLLRNLDRAVMHIRDEQKEKYSPLLALTVRERPFGQEYFVGETVLYFISPKMNRIYRAEVNVEFGKYGSLERVFVNAGLERSLGFRMLEDINSGKNVYQVFNPSRKVRLKALLVHVLNSLTKEYGQRRNDVPEHVFTLANLRDGLDNHINYWLDVEREVRDDSLTQKYLAGELFDQQMKGEGKPN
jgi:hypothetical protein